MIKKMFLFVFGLVAITTVAWAQTQVTGKVTDEKGNPIVKATITEKGTRNAVPTDENGNFKITVKSTTSTLVISAVSFEILEVNTSNSSNIKLKQAKEDLTEIIVTAQGIKKKSKEIGYSYAKIDNAEITLGHAPQFAQSLSGKISGLAIYTINNSVEPQSKIVLRGYRSLTGNNEALIVVDGIQTTSTILSLINPNDIESSTILKGGQAAALYGSAGVNGAILITTKKGKAGKLNVNFVNSTNFEQISFLPQFQDKYGSGSHYATSYGAAGYKTNYLDRMHDNWRPFENQQYGDAFDGSLRPVGRTINANGDYLSLPYSPVANSREKSFDVGSNVNNFINFSTGDDKGTFYLSIENQQLNGIVPGDKSNRTGFRLASTRNYGDLTLNYSASYVQANYDRTTADFYYLIFNTAANVPIDRYRNWQTDPYANPNGYYNDYFQNPFFEKDNNRSKYTDNNLNGVVEINYKLKPWITLTDRIGVLNNTRVGKYTTGKFTYSNFAKNLAVVPAPFDWANDYDGIDRASTDIAGAVADYTYLENVVNNEFQANLTKDIGKFSNKLLLGYSVYQRKTKAIFVNSTSIVVPEIYNVSNRQGNLDGNEANTLERKFGYYADFSSNFNKYLTLEAVFRYDYTSRFYAPNRDASLYAFPYYGASLAFQLTDALPSIKSVTLNDIKFKASYNKNGNDNLPLYALDLTYGNATGFPFGSNVGLTVGNVLPNSGLKPEFVTTVEFGTEIALFNNRVNFEAVYYNQSSVDQVITVKVPNSTGFSNLLINVGETQNKGLELDLKVQIIKSKDFSWEVGFRYSKNENKVVALYPGINEFSYGGYAYATSNVIVGQSFPQLKTTGYYYDDAGRRRVNPESGYPIQNTSLLSRGNVLPTDLVGFSSKLKYKRWSLNWNMEYRGGNVIFSQIGRDMTFTGSGKWTENRAPHIFENSYYIDANTNKNTPNSTVQARESEYGLWVDNYRLIAENFVSPAWFIKLREINLVYDVSENFIKKSKVFKAASVSIFGRNLFTIIDKSNYYTDPEFSYNSQSINGTVSSVVSNAGGINNTFQTPPTRQYGFNINLTF